MLKPSKLIVGIGLITLIASIYMAHYFYVWLVKPEQSLVAKLQTYSDQQNCFSCHQANGQPQTGAELPKNNHYLYAKSDWQMYFKLLSLEQDAKYGDYNSNPLYQAEMLARKYNCFLCHGKFGQGGVANKGGLKSYIPGWFGTDFAHLTNHNDKVKIKQWIQTGMNQDILDLPILGEKAKQIFAQQELSMIALPYLSEHELNLLVDYVAYLHQLGEITAQSLKQYQDDVRTAKQEGITPIQVELIHD